LDNLIQYWQDQSDSEFPGKWCYISTTGVYAPRDDGGWVDECSEVIATRPGAIAAKYAEEWFDREIFSRCPDSEASEDSWNGCVLRAAGIYGPGRVPRLESLINHEALAIDPDSYLNLIHVVDLAQIVVTACQGLGPHRLYNVADGNPVRRRDYYEYIAGQIGCLPPRFELSAESRVGRARGEGSKRVNTARLQDKLECSLQFPTYREGLGPLLRK
jgi:nucleoside-diphosphate-sugar epimerase